MKPILFNTQMVQAILTGQKTQTRRLMGLELPPQCDVRRIPDGRRAGEWHLYCDNPLLDGPNRSPWGMQIVPPYNHGDVLYVRETWRLNDPRGDFKRCDRTAVVTYKADMEESIRSITPELEKFLGNRWRPSLHMPRGFARLFLSVENVWPERLKEITLSEIWDEGLSYSGESTEREVRQSFGKLWDSTIQDVRKSTCEWGASPWVWVIQFHRISGEEAMKNA